MSDENLQGARPGLGNAKSADVVVVGAGVAGLACARQLRRAGLEVLVLEKSVGLGGRMATRRVEHAGQTVPVDHGVQYLTADSDSFYRWLKELLGLGLLREWTRSLHLLDREGLRPEDSNAEKPRYICPQGMTTLAKQLATSLSIHTQTRVVGLRPLATTWQLQAENGQCYEAAAVVMAIPAPQLLPLLQEGIPPADNLLSLPGSAAYQPCIAVLAGYSKSTPLPPWKGIKCLQDPMLAWLALDSSKRLQPLPPLVVLHGGAEWSSRYLDAGPAELEKAGRELLDHAAKRLDPWLASPQWMQVHRWRYAFPMETIGLASLGTHVPAGAGKGLPLVCAGDWCAGERVEGAWLSGQDAAKTLLEMLGIPAHAR